MPPTNRKSLQTEKTLKRQIAELERKLEMLRKQVSSGESKRPSRRVSQREGKKGQARPAATRRVASPPKFSPIRLKEGKAEYNRLVALGKDPFKSALDFAIIKHYKKPQTIQETQVLLGKRRYIWSREKPAPQRSPPIKSKHLREARDTKIAEAREAFYAKEPKERILNLLKQASYLEGKSRGLNSFTMDKLGKGRRNFWVKLKAELGFTDYELRTVLEYFYPEKKTANKRSKPAKAKGQTQIMEGVGVA